ncbi:MAG: guanylate kinase [Lachnospiraceae bacterium]|nr:guanylate kinase [Lachnospiraceae bacterium]
MNRIYVIIGKSASGKDTIAKRLLSDSSLRLEAIVPYTTRPIRAGEKNGTDYFFTDDLDLRELRAQGKVIECRTYHTVYGDWNYFTADDGQIDLTKSDSLTVGTIESYVSFRNYFGEDRVTPIYIEVDDGERLTRALEREKKQQVPKYEEMCRRFLADQQDFSEEKLRDAGIDRRFENKDIDETVAEIADVIRQRK